MSKAKVVRYSEMTAPQLNKALAEFTEKVKNDTDKYRHTKHVPIGLEAVALKLNRIIRIGSGYPRNKFNNVQQAAFKKALAIVNKQITKDERNKYD